MTHMATGKAYNSSSNIIMKDVRSPITNFSSSLWTDTCASFSLNDQVQEKYAKEREILKEEARSMLTTKGLETNTIDKLVLIDTLERLGVAYHFENEIEDQLEQMRNNLQSDRVDDNEEYSELFATALQFRLLRQHRHHVSCNVFEKFKDDDTNQFKESLNMDAKGLLSLYEASQVRTHGESILDEAIEFTRHKLNIIVLNLEASPIRDQVKRALVVPLHRSIPRIETRIFIDIYETDATKNDKLVKLAKLDFNFLQSLYKKELSDLIRWFNKFELQSKLPYSRDRVVECYMWSLGFHFEPQYSYARTSLARSVQMITTIDDTYDNYATLEEADLFTKILERWDANEVDCLPDCMKIVYRYILSIHEEYEREAEIAEKGFAVPYAKETAIQLCRAYNKELKWLMGEKMFTHEEYLCNTFVTSGFYVIYAAITPGIKSLSQETINWLVREPNKILHAAAKIARYLNDLGSHQREKKEGRIFTGVDCYMKEHGLSSIEEVKHKFLEQVEDAWRDLNKEWLANTNSCMPNKEILVGFLNYARAAQIFYHQFVDGITDPHKSLAPYVKALILDPILII